MKNRLITYLAGVLIILPISLFSEEEEREEVELKKLQ